MQSKFFSTPFATAGDKIDIPDTAQVDGSVSFATGFGPDYEKELGVDPDAKPVPRDATNGVLYDITDALGAIQKQGAPQFIEAADNGGAPFSYGRGARVMYGNPARPWVSRVDNNTTAPAAGANWALEVFEVATNAQAIAGTDPALIITPPGLKAALDASVAVVPDATEAVKGIQRNATQAEANAGVLDTATMTPIKTAGAITQQVPTATTAVAGRSRLATQAEVNSAAAGALVVTPATLAGPLAGKVGTVGSGQTINSGALGSSVGAEFVSLGLTANTGNFDTLESILVRAGSGTDWSTARWVLRRRVDATTQGFIQFEGGASGYALVLGVGTTSGALMDFSGNFKFTGSVTADGGFQQGSSRTVKDHVSDIDPAQALRNVLALRGVLYRYHGAEEVRAGYYAEEVRESRPEAVTEAGEGSFSPLLLEDAQMLPDHTGAIQELYRMIRELQEKTK
ncbi:MAG: hypothetical protein RSG92_15195 [Pseudomonas sp.]